jgi:dihydrofolate reductase
VIGEVTALKERVRGDILVAGSATLVQTLLEHRLVDELRLMVFPIVLGTGKRLFGKVSEPPVLVLDNVEAVGEGIVILTYRAGR